MRNNFIKNINHVLITMGEFNAKTGMDIAFGSIFILAIGLTIANDTITTLALSGIAGTVLGYVPLVIAAVFLYMIARMGGVL